MDSNVCSACLDMTTSSVPSALSDREFVQAVEGSINFDLVVLRDQYSSAIATFWTLLSAFVAFLILAGSALIEVAVSRSRSDNVLFKYGVGVCISAMFWVFGYVLAYGEGNLFIGGP